MNVTSHEGILDKTYTEYEATVLQNEEHRPKRARVAEPEIPQPQDTKYQGKHIAQRSVAEYEAVVPQSEEHKLRKLNVIRPEIPPQKNAEYRGKHMVQRSAEEWGFRYGDPKIWDDMFEEAVISATKKLQSENMKSKELVEYLSGKRAAIAKVRKNPCADEFGKIRPEYTCVYTFISKNENIYGYALDRAVNIKYDEHFSAECCPHTVTWMKTIALQSCSKAFGYGLVSGSLQGEKIPLTQYVYIPVFAKDSLRASFGADPDDYVFGVRSRKETALWLHTNPKHINKVMEHIYSLIDKALSGDLTTIPRIHWWYVHLAPDHRGSGGIAEMITNSLCRLHGHDLPAWSQGIAPSVEVLLEPSEEKFCENYHKLFACGHDNLRKIFSGTSAHSCT